MISSPLPQPKIVSRDEWLIARQALLAREKELTRLRDRLAAERCALPWVKVETEYVFDGPHGKETLADLFAGRSQLIVHHFMLGPDWEADNVDGALVHLAPHDVSFVRVSRAPLAKIDAFRRRMGWPAKWVSSHGSAFNFDYHVSFTKDDMARGGVYYNYATTKAVSDELSGFSVFCTDASGAVFHTYSCYARGDEDVLGTYFFLDRTPKGRNESGPNHNLMDWVRHHDRYDAAPAASCCHGNGG